jgi:hypothetical protein
MFEERLISLFDGVELDLCEKLPYAVGLFEYLMAH